ANDRHAFVVARKDVMHQIISLAERNQDVQDAIDKNTVNREQHRTLVQRRKEVVAALEKEKAKVHQEADTAVALQSQTEQETFSAEKAVTDSEAKNRELVEKLKGLENGR